MRSTQKSETPCACCHEGFFLSWVRSKNRAHPDGTHETRRKQEKRPLHKTARYFRREYDGRLGQKSRGTPNFMLNRAPDKCDHKSREISNGGNDHNTLHPIVLFLSQDMEDIVFHNLHEADLHVYIRSYILEN